MPLSILSNTPPATHSPSTPGAQRGAALGRPLFALAALAILASAATAITWFVTSRPSSADVQVQQAPAPIVEPAPIFLPLDAFTVTLRNDDMERLLHVAVTLKMGNERSRVRLHQYLPELRSRFLLILTEQSPDDVQTQAGKQRLAQQLRDAANEPFDNSVTGGQQVADILFTAFVVQ